jgi:O-antigen ligase
VAVVLLLLSVGLLLSPTIAVWMRATGSVDVLTSGRSYLVPVAAEIIEEHPLTGVGLGNFSSHAVALLSSAGAKYGTANPHNLPLYVASESGIVAGIACFLFILGAGTMATRILFRSRDPLVSALASVVLTGVLLSLVSAGVIFGNPFLNIPWWIAFAALLRVRQGRRGTALPAWKGDEGDWCHSPLWQPSAVSYAPSLREAPFPGTRDLEQGGRETWGDSRSTRPSFVRERHN